MTDELYNALAKYEDTFDRVRRRQYAPNPGLPALQLMMNAIREHRPNYKTNLGCSNCVRTLVLEASGLYYTEKDKREKTVKDEPVVEPEPAPKKTTRKKKTEE
jgi:hypothetical protein